MKGSAPYTQIKDDQALPSDLQYMAKKKQSFCPCVTKIVLIGAFLIGVSYYLEFIYYSPDAKKDL